MILSLPWQGKDTPCAILDIIRGCNARCAYCFNQDDPYRRTTEEVREDLKELRQKRNLQSVMISGGEPTLHPDLLTIVRDCAQAGLKVILLTNGILLDRELACALADAGCSLCFIHLQQGQKRPDLPHDATDETLDACRLDKARLLHEAGIAAGYIVTLEEQNAADFDAEIRRYLTQNLFSHLLLTTAKDAGDFSHGLPMQDVDIPALAARFKKYGFPPFAVLRGRYDRNQARWFSFQIVERVDRGGVVRGRIGLRASAGEWLVMRLRRLLTGHYDFFLEKATPFLLHSRLLLNGLTGGGIKSLLFGLSAFLRNESLRFKVITLETPPFRREDGTIEHCCDCPGAVYKDGRLKPLCLADVKMDE